MRNNIPPLPPIPPFVAAMLTDPRRLPHKTDGGWPDVRVLPAFPRPSSHPIPPHSAGGRRAPFFVQRLFAACGTQPRLPSPRCPGLDAPASHQEKGEAGCAADLPPPPKCPRLPRLPYRQRLRRGRRRSSSRLTAAASRRCSAAGPLRSLSATHCVYNDTSAAAVACGMPRTVRRPRPAPAVYGRRP